MGAGQENREKTLCGAGTQDLPESVVKAGEPIKTLPFPDLSGIRGRSYLPLGEGRSVERPSPLRNYQTETVK